MTTLDVNTQTLAIDEDGHLLRLDDWSRAVAQILAEQENITLDKRHWEIIELLREFHTTFELSPAMRPLIKFLKLKLGKDKGRSIYLMQLFPPSPARVASKIAGLPKPENCL